MRRMLLLERDANKAAAAHHSKLLNRAHNAAMQMPSHVWDRGVVERSDGTINAADFLADQPDDNEESFRNGGATGLAPADPSMVVGVSPDDFCVERTCALLAGLAMRLAEGVDEARLGDAFSRLVELPFIQTLEPAEDVARVVLVSREWYYYRRSGNKPPTVFVRGPGLAGLAACAAALVRDIDTRMGHVVA